MEPERIEYGHCENCNEINKIEHLVEKIFPANTNETNSQHLVKMKSLPKEGNILKIFPCCYQCFFCIGEKHGISAQEQHDASKMYTDLPGDKREEMKNQLISNWETGSNTKEIFARYKTDIPVIQCMSE